MPQTGLDLEGGQRGARHNTWRVSHVPKEQIPERTWINRAGFQHGCSAASRTSESSPVGSLDLPKQAQMLNGFVNHRHKGRRTKAAPPKKFWARESKIVPVTHGSGAGMERKALVLGGISAGAAAGPGAGHLGCKSEQVVPNPSSSELRKNQRRRKKFRQKKKRDEALESGCSAPPQQEQEDWEEEIQEVTLKNWEKMCFGISAYGPEDVIHFELRDLSLRQSTEDDLPATADYSPAVHHTRPIRWRCYRAPTEPDQFANAEE